jgi:predicted ribosome-associated RNA-binding protein Tma20
VVCIRDCKGDIIAIGAMSCSYDELKKNSDGSGVAVYILHYKGDKLWDMGTKAYPDIIIDVPAAKKEE